MFAAEYILRTRPAAVVVETAVTPEHGARPGNSISCKDRLVEGPAAFYMRMFCSVSHTQTYTHTHSHSRTNTDTHKHTDTEHRRTHSGGQAQVKHDMSV